MWEAALGLNPFLRIRQTIGRKAASYSELLRASMAWSWLKPRFSRRR